MKNDAAARGLAPDNFIPEENYTLLFAILIGVCD
jgi:hypothetical protein